LAEEKKKLIKGDLKAPKKIQPVAFEPSQDETRLLSLFRMCASALPNKKEHKLRNLKKRYYLLSLLEEKGELTPNELLDYSELSKEKLESLLNKLEDKKYIIQKKESTEENIISITESGINALNEHRVKRGNKELMLFDSLSDEETEHFQHILEKLYTYWSSGEEE
jgi:DNA-binding MarR family transcriptional regulator